MSVVTPVPLWLSWLQLRLLRQTLTGRQTTSHARPAPHQTIQTPNPPGRRRPVHDRPVPPLLPPLRRQEGILVRVRRLHERRHQPDRVPRGGQAGAAQLPADRRGHHRRDLLCWARQRARPELAAAALRADLVGRGQHPGLRQQEGACCAVRPLEPQLSKHCNSAAFCYSTPTLPAQLRPPSSTPPPQ
jgi:hypothetical protein